MFRCYCGPWWQLSSNLNNILIHPHGTVDQWQLYLRAILQESEAKLEMKNFNFSSIFVCR